MTDLLPLLKGVARSGDGWTARCPAHDDGHNSLTIHHRDGRWLLKCHAGCEWQAIIEAVGLVSADLSDDEEHQGGGRRGCARNRATAQPTARTSTKPHASQIPEAPAPTEGVGLTLARYAAAKRLSINFLKSCALSEFTFERKPAVRVPYFGEDGEERAVRFRIALDGDRFRWKSGAKPCLYGLNRLPEMKNTGRVSRASPVHTAMRNCTRDEGGPFETGNQMLVSSHRKLLSSKAMVVSVAECRGKKNRQARLREASASKPSMKCRKL
jgi:hypothetical protein